MLLLLFNDISHHSFIHATFTIQISVAFVILTVVEVFIYKLNNELEEKEKVLLKFLYRCNCAAVKTKMISEIFSVAVLWENATDFPIFCPVFYMDMHVKKSCLRELLNINAVINLDKVSPDTSLNSRVHCFSNTLHLEILW